MDRSTGLLMETLRDCLERSREQHCEQVSVPYWVAERAIAAFRVYAALETGESLPTLSELAEKVWG